MKNNKIYLKVILFSIILMCVSFISAQKTEMPEDGSSDFIHWRRDLKPVTKKWFATQKADGKWQVVGEAFYKNLGRRSQNIDKISLFVYTKSGFKKRIYAGKDFGEMLFIGSWAENGEYVQRPLGTTTVEPKDEALALLASDDLTDEKLIFARIQIQFENRPDANLFMKISEFKESPKYEMPFDFEEDKFWFSGNTAGTYTHWSAILPQPFTNFFLSQRYATDFVKINADGEYSSPSGSPNKEDYFAWNKDIKSAESGEVVAIVNYLPDVEIGQTDLEHVAGNYVVIKHAPRVFALYAHMKQSSNIVQIGQKINKGQVIGKVGNSGNTALPHLHFHVMDNWDYLHPVWSVFTSQGLPALFRNAQVFRDGEFFPLNGNSLSEFDIILKQ